jgi:hypothetical protein
MSMLDIADIEIDVDAHLWITGTYGARRLQNKVSKEDILPFRQQDAITPGALYIKITLQQFRHIPVKKSST